MKELWDTMKTLERSLQPDATALLINLAKLAQRAGTATSDTFNDSARDLLEHLRNACSARRGAIVLMMAANAPTEQHTHHAGQNNTLRHLALHEMREEEVRALLSAAEPAMNLMEVTTGEGLHRIISRLPLAEEQGMRSWDALVLLEWGELARDREAFEQGKRMLPLLADAAVSVLTSLLQAERLHELEQALLQEELATMDLFKAELIATVSHELRSPLASVKGYAATLLRHERRLSRDERHQFLLAISEGAARLERIVDRLLEMSELETGAIPLNLAPVDTVRLAQEALRAAEETLSDKVTGRFTFNLLVENSAGQLAENVPLVVVDVRRLREVLDNLLENALHYSPEGGVITVALRPVPVDWPLARGTQPVARQRRSMLELCVCDTGIGIATEHLERIFERFYRVDKRLTREVNGLGLGLAMCRRIVELHNGAIWAESLPEGGSIFHVLLPLAAENEP